MAKKSKIAKNDRRKRIVARCAQRRAELKASPGAPARHGRREGRRADGVPPPAPGREATRVRNRDGVDGRPRGHLRRFGLSRVNARAPQAHAGHLSGVTKSSW
ncbi:30S ribosomal protein S14 [Streptomyces sp. SID685]|uniref:30S ribosomal protein S14 n=1 Tax=Streptomyces sp. SID685 TaxID=2690322 RepID=UPI00136A054B|nr:30S ribosomal protein S14 [Streptomyces sp. SID685]MYR90476.1 30S ribosomal protein S14 [Streptomyces sp. SID685]